MTLVPWHNWKMMSASEAKDFLHFIKNDAQLKAFGQCVEQVDLLALDSNARAFNQRPNRTALVVVSTHLFCLIPRKGLSAAPPSGSCRCLWSCNSCWLSLFFLCRMASVVLTDFMEDTFLIGVVEDNGKIWWAFCQPYLVLVIRPMFTWPFSIMEQKRLNDFQHGSKIK